MCAPQRKMSFLASATLRLIGPDRSGSKPQPPVRAEAVPLGSVDVMDRKTQINIWYALIALLAVLLIQQWWIQRQQVQTIPYSQFDQGAKLLLEKETLTREELPVLQGLKMAAASGLTA